MNQPQYFEPQLVAIKGRAGLDERWVQARIVDNPKLLGLGDLVVKDKERSQPGGGRLDLLLQDPETARRYEVEIQLGRTDETHIIRTIEYWDIERKRYPQYDHCAVIVAEEITGRFLNVISLFNGFVPVIALRMQAIAVGDAIGLIFTKRSDSNHLSAQGRSRRTKSVYSAEVSTKKHQAVKEGELPASELLQNAVRAEVRRRELLAASEKYIADLTAEVGKPSAQQRARAAAVSRRIAIRSQRKAS
jgi:hypothetical protein